MTPKAAERIRLEVPPWAGKTPRPAAGLPAAPAAGLPAMSVVGPVAACPFAAAPRQLSFTADIEPSPADPAGTRHLAATDALLDLLDESGARGTFFVLGEVAAAAPGLVRRIAGRGHEVASHNQTHRALAALGPTGLLAEAREARARLQDLSGQAVAGFRAPYFSLTPDTEWAAEVLLEAGHGYSSSVLPARGFLHGHPAAPRRPFAWPCGLLELPAPVARLGPMHLPALGGMYLRYLPAFDLRRMLPRLEGPVAWTYCHPYDIDAAEPFRWCGTLGLAGSVFLWANRGVTVRRLRAMLAGRVSVPLGERLEEARAAIVLHGPTRSPGAPGPAYVASRMDDHVGSPSTRPS